MSLADKIIQAEEDEVIRRGPDDQAPEGYYTDDMGYWVEEDIRKNKARFAEYIYLRCLRINQHLYMDPDDFTVYNRHKVILPEVSSIVELANIPEMITTAQAIWVYNKLKETVPRLDKNRIVVAPGLAWNIKEARLEELKGEYYTTGGSDDA